MTADSHDRYRPGLNHLALSIGDRSRVDALIRGAPAHGWMLLFEDAHPYAGGASHYGGYLVNSDGFEVELVADAGAESRCGAADEMAP